MTITSERVFHLLDLFEGNLGFSDFNPPKKAPTLRVRRVLPAEMPSIPSIARNWQNEASELSKQSCFAQEILKDSVAVNKSIADRLEKVLRRDEEIYICETEEDRVPQGLSIVSQKLCPEKTINEVIFQEKCLEINWLASRPKNLVSSRENPEMIRGVGTALVTAAEDRAKALKLNGVFLHSVTGAEGFYKKRGFRFENGYYWDAHYYKKVTDTNRYFFACPNRISKAL